MNKRSVFMALFATIIMFSSCDRESQSTSSKEGVLKIQLNADFEINNLSTREPLGNLPNVSDFSLNLYQGNDLYMAWDKFSDMKESQVLPTGTYSAIAKYGDVNEEGFDVSPAFLGNKDFTIKDGEVTEVSITSSLQNALVNIFYSDGFTDYFKEYTTTLTSSLKNEVVFNAGETKTAYFKPGTMIISLNVKAVGTTEFTKLVAGKIDLEAKKIYNITLDANSNTSTLIITFNDGVSDYEDIDIDISDVALNMTAPSQIAVGYTSGEEMEVIEGQSVGTVQTKIYSAGALKDCTLITQSTALLSQGWPAEIDLFEASPEQLSLMTSLGLKLVNFNVNAGAVYVDFTKVIPFLEYSANEEDAIATFSVVATDKYSKPAKEASILMVKSLDNNFGFSLIENVPYEVTTVTGTVQLNGDINVISYQQLVNGNWQPIQISSLTKVGDSYSITLNLASPADDSSSTLQIKAICGRRELIATSHIEAPVIHAEVAQVGDVWSSKAVFTVENISPTTRSMNTNYVRMEYYTNGEWIKPTQTVSGNKITVTGLSANTSYTFRAHYIDAITATNTSVSSEITITTESASQVPNADMNDWNTEATKKLGKTKWNGLNPTTYYAYIPKSGSWATSNAKTFNHSSSGTMNYAINAYPSVVKETRTNNGEVAVVRSIGWNDGAGNSYEGITGNVCKHRSAGKLFLGTYSFDIDNKLDTYNYGIEFTSRPQSISFDFKYSSYNNDKFKVWAVVENRDGGVTKRLAYGEIAAGNAASDYTNTTFQLTYDDAYSSLKATHFYIVFSSSYQCSDVHATESSLLDAANALHAIDGSYWGGSVLYIDNIQLNY